MGKRSILQIHKLLRIFTICFTVGFSQAVFSEELDTKAIQKLKWQQGESQNIKVYSDMHPRKVLSLLNLLEDFASYCQIIFSIGSQDRDFKMNLFVAGKSRTWKSLGQDPLYVNSSWNNGQSFTSMVRIDSAFTGTASTSSSARTHLYKVVADLHIRKSSHANSFPLWYLDGMTRYLATYERKGDTVSVGQLSSVQSRLRSLINATRQIEAFDLSEVISRESLPPIADGESSRTYLDRINELLSLNLMLVHYFYADADRQVQLNKYLTLLGHNLGSEDAMIEATGLTLQSLGEDFYRYLKSRKLYAQTHSFAEVDSRINKIQGDSFAQPTVQQVDGNAVIAAYNGLIPN